MSDLVKDWKLEEPCGVCREPCGAICTGCYKITYCSPDHQKEDWKNHKKICRPYPVQLKQHKDASEELRGKCWVATKRIRPGETVLKETSLISGPYLNIVGTCADPPMDRIKTVCLSCYEELSSDAVLNLCSTCEWPVCDSNCEKKSIHAEMECKVFAEQGLKPLPLEEEVKNKRDIYMCILTLRILLLRKLNPFKWINILNLPTSEEFNSLQCPGTEDTVKFIQEECGLKEFDQSLIERIIRILYQNGWGNEMTDGRFQQFCAWLRTGICIYPRLGYLERCGLYKNPNADGTIVQSSTNKHEFVIEIKATRTIEPGEAIKQKLVMSEKYKKVLLNHYSSAPAFSPFSMFP